MSTMMNTIDLSVMYAPPSLDDIEQDVYPDPEGYYVGQEEYNDADADDEAYDDVAYEPDVFSYDYY